MTERDSSPERSTAIWGVFYREDYERHGLEKLFFTESEARKFAEHQMRTRYAGRGQWRNTDKRTWRNGSARIELWPETVYDSFAESQKHHDALTAKEEK